MIVKKMWMTRHRGGILVKHWCGYYLFGFIPLYIKQLNMPDFTG